MQQRDDEWRQARVGKITGSRAADLMDYLKNGKPGAKREELIAMLVAERLSGNHFETQDSFAMRRGREMEPEALGFYALTRTNLIVEEPFIVSEDLPNTGCSPDGLVDDDGLVEIKCPLNAAKHLAAIRIAAHAEEYKWQVQLQLLVTGREWCDVVSYHPQFPEDCRLAIKRVYRDADALEELSVEIRTTDALVEQTVEEVRRLAA